MNFPRQDIQKMRSSWTTPLLNAKIHVEIVLSYVAYQLTDDTNMCKDKPKDLADTPGNTADAADDFE